MLASVSIVALFASLVSSAPTYTFDPRSLGQWEAPIIAARNSLPKPKAAQQAVQAGYVVGNATAIAPGNYLIRNVGNGQYLYYLNSQDQSLWPAPASSNLSPAILSLEQSPDNSHLTRVKPKSANNKCLSAQWNQQYDDGSNWAGVLYACAVGTGANPNSTVRPAKQYWAFVSASGQEGGSSPFYIVPTDHLLDMPTRGMKGYSRQTSARGQISTGIDVLTYGDVSQQWELIPTSAAATGSSSVLPASATKKAATTTSVKKAATSSAKPVSSSSSAYQVAQAADFTKVRGS